MICQQLLEQATKLIDTSPVECIFNYGVWQENYNNINTSFPIKFIEGVSKIDDLPKDRKHRLWIIDDLMNDIASSAAISELFTKFSHHLNYSVIILCQNLFDKGKFFRTISLNTQYLWLLKSVRDTSMISTLGRQMGDSKFLTACYKDATSTPYGHLFLDMKPGSDDRYRIRSNTFDEPSVVFLK